MGDEGKMDCQMDFGIFFMLFVVFVVAGRERTRKRKDNIDSIRLAVSVFAHLEFWI